MNDLEKKIVDILIDLKENHHIDSIKAEFETEGTLFEEAIHLKEVTTRAGLNLTIKIGGCGAIKDMYEARNIGANTIIAPMIETYYAMQKYIQSINDVFSEREKSTMNFLINIETITGINNIDEMIHSDYFDSINGIVLGRTDLTRSINLLKDDVNSDEILKLTNLISKKMQRLNKDMIVGGGICANAIPFLKKLSYLSKFETRKVIFDLIALSDCNIEKGINKALKFELMWIENKQNFYNIINKNDIHRTEILKNLICDKCYIC